jgi:uncharacterized membrane protein YraQ (UPF0718 family)
MAMAIHTSAARTEEQVPRRRGPDGQNRRTAIIGFAGFVVLTGVLLLWAKWWPYAGKAHAAFETRSWSSPAVLDTAARAGNGPHLADAWTFTVAYAAAVWKAWVAGLLIAAAASALVPRPWLLSALGRDRGRGVVAGGVLGTVMLMCTACAAPVTASLRRDGARSSSTLAYLYANPVLNPAVLAILAFVGPWQWVTTRLAIGLVLVFGFPLLIGRLAKEPAGSPPVRPEEPVTRIVAPTSAANMIVAFVRRLGLLAVTLTPIYVLVVFVQGWFRGWLFPLHGETTMVLALVVAVVLGTIIDLPTAGEVPVILALSAAGLGTAATGALLLTLPAISLVTMALIWRSHGRRTTALAGSAVAVAGLLGASMLSVLAA